MTALAGGAAFWFAASLAVTHAAQARPAGAGWGPATEVPGLGSLNVGGFAEVLSVSCASPGNCAAGGYYSDGFENGQAFVASQRNGRWSTAIEVPGLAPLNLGGGAEVLSVSCASAGNCAAGGYTRGGSGREQAFVTSERNGRWDTAIEVPGTLALNAGGNAQVSSVSCASAGNCAAGGSYRDGSGFARAFVASQRNGRWGTAIEVPGMAALNVGGNAEVLSVSCTSAGNCAAGGFYYRSPNRHAFVVSQRNRRWGKAIGVPGIESLNAGGNAGISSVSCGSAGNCAAGGFYAGSSFGFFSQAFVASEQNGRWGSGIEVPGTATLNSGTQAEVTSVSCNRPGPCTAGGFYTESTEGTEHSQGFIVSRS